MHYPRKTPRIDAVNINSAIGGVSVRIENIIAEQLYPEMPVDVVSQLYIGRGVTGRMPGFYAGNDRMEIGAALLQRSRQLAGVR